eukprot:scaffold114565_cov63-Phaeocystis_antarctica.AAC.3
MGPSATQRGLLQSSARSRSTASSSGQVRVGGRMREGRERVPGREGVRGCRGCRGRCRAEHTCGAHVPRAARLEAEGGGRLAVREPRAVTAAVAHRGADLACLRLRRRSSAQQWQGRGIGGFWPGRAAAPQPPIGP